MYQDVPTASHYGCYSGRHDNGVLAVTVPSKPLFMSQMAAIKRAQPGIHCVTLYKNNKVHV